MSKQDKRNNTFSRSSLNPPMPPNYDGGNDDFSIVRTLDSHYFGRNGHFPNGDDGTPNLDANYDEVIDPSQDYDD